MCSEHAASAGRKPSSFAQARMRIDGSGLRLPPRIEALVEGLLEPLQEERMTAAQALATLQQPESAIVRHAPLLLKACGCECGCSCARMGSPVCRHPQCKLAQSGE